MSETLKIPRYLLEILPVATTFNRGTSPGTNVAVTELPLIFEPAIAAAYSSSARFWMYYADFVLASRARVRETLSATACILVFVDCWRE